MRNTTIDRRLRRLCDLLPEARWVELSYLGCDRWRVAVSLGPDDEQVAIAAGWTKWPGGLSLGIGGSVRDALNSADYYAGQLHAVLHGHTSEDSTLKAAAERINW